MTTSVDENKANWKRSINYACMHFLQEALRRQGAASNDIVDTLAAELTEKVWHLAEWCQEQRGDAEILSRAISYLTIHHDGPWKGPDWFVDALHILIEIAVPMTGMDETTAEFLMDMQRGISQSQQNAPTYRANLRVTDEVASDARMLQEAGCEYGIVSSLLDLNEAIFHGEVLTENQHDLLLTAATAAPFTRQERLSRKID
ncbi:hypothetical protein [Collimonas humicola]|uniref:hypothetical protein n=1 Tax=Collimonas humicola TaxID=2825886 RepID=UPI001B8B0B63|nr:hypothetical protein [Collimonas humicola]